MSEHCSDHTLSAVTTVFAKAVFAVDNTELEQLPLEALYNHEDFVDLISAHEFGIDALFPSRTLLCVAIAKRTDALDEMEQLITGTTRVNEMIATAQVQGDHICVTISGQEFLIPNAENTTDLHSALLKAPGAAWLAGLGAWCTGYRVVLYGSKEML